RTPGTGRPCAATPRRFQSRAGRRLAAARPSPLFSQELVQHLDVERLVSDDALEAAVLLLQLPQSLRLARLHAAVLPLPAVERGRGDAMLTTQIIDRGAGVCLAENSYDLLVCEPALPHPVLLSRTDIIAGSGSGEHFRRGAYNGKAIPRQRWGQPVNPPSVRVRNLPGRYNPASLRRAPYPYVGSRCSPPDTDRSLGTGCASNCCHNHRIVVLRACGWAYSVR